MSTFPQFSLLPKELQLLVCRIAFKTMTDQAVICSFDEQVQWYTPKLSEDLSNVRYLANTCHRFRTLYLQFAKPHIPVVHNLPGVCDLSRWYEGNGYILPTLGRTDRRNLAHPNGPFLDIRIFHFEGIRYTTFYEITEAAALRQHWQNAPRGWCAERADIFDNATDMQDDTIFLQTLTLNLRIKKQCLLQGVVARPIVGRPVFMPLMMFMDSAYEIVLGVIRETDL